MKFKKLFTLTAIFLSATMLFGCAKKDEFNPSFKDKGQKIYLYGEFHGVKKIYEEELKIIEKHYNEGVRDMFIEASFSNGEFLNIWMKEKDNKILDDLIEDAKGTFGGTELNRNFYLTIKEKFPEIRFHGTDIEHKQTSYRYSMYLDENNIKDDFARKFVSDNREQKIIYEAERNFRYREEKMVENFKRQYEKVGNKPIFGFYGNAHLDLSNGNVIHRKSTDGYIMGEELKKLYGDSFVYTDITNIDTSIGTEKINVKGKVYNSKYFGKFELSSTVSSETLEVWELENAYDDFKNIDTYGTDIIYDSVGIAKLKKNTVYKLLINGQPSYVRTDEEDESGVIQGRYLKFGE